MSPSVIVSSLPTTEKLVMDDLDRVTAIAEAATLAYQS